MVSPLMLTFLELRLIVYVARGVLIVELHVVGVASLLGSQQFGDDHGVEADVRAAPGSPATRRSLGSTLLWACSGRRQFLRNRRSFGDHQRPDPDEAGAFAAQRMNSCRSRSAWAANRCPAFRYAC